MNDQTLKHMEWIQATIARMAQHSFTMKGAAVTLVSAALVLAVNRHEPNSLLVALLPAVVFWGLDAYYLRQERLFRALYDAVRTGALSGTSGDTFSMDTSPYNLQVPSWWGTCWTRTIFWLYVPMILFTWFVGDRMALH